MGEFKSPSEKQSAKAAPAKKSQENSNVGEADLLDTRSSTFQLGKIQEAAQDSGRRSDISSLQTKSSNHTGTSRIAQLQRMSDERTASKQSALTQKNANKTGIPDGLKSGMESVSGISLNDVTVHRNSNKPAQLQAHAYAQGTDIHLGPGQEKHLPHEAWHVVQQKQGRVQATTQGNGNVPINDNPSLEREATQMGQKALKESNSGSSTLKNVTISPNNPAQLWSFPWSKKKEEEKPAEPQKDIKKIVAEHPKKGQRNELPSPQKEPDLKQTLAKRRALLGYEPEELPANKGIVEDVPRAAGFNQDFQNKLGGMISTKKNEELNKKSDAFQGHALKQSAYADRAKPGEENSWGSWFKSKANAVGRGINNAKEAGKNMIGNTWLGKKMGISGLNKNERDAADAKANEISRGDGVVKSYNKEGGELESQASKIGLATTVGAFVAGKAPIGGKVLKNTVKAAGSAAKENRYKKASNAYEKDTGDELVNYGSKAKGKGLKLKGQQAHLDTQTHLAAAAGAGVDELNPAGKLAHLVSEATMGYVELPSAESVAKGLVKAKNYKEQSRINEESKGVNAEQALAFARQNTGGINREALAEHKIKNKGLLSELNSKFDDGTSIMSKAGISEKGDPKLKSGVLKAIAPKQKEEKKTMNIGGMQIDPGHFEKFLAKAGGNEPEGELDDDNDW